MYGFNYMSQNLIFKVIDDSFIVLVFQADKSLQSKRC